MGHSKNSTKRKLPSITGLPQETNLTLDLKELEKKHQTKSKVNQRKEILKIIAEKKKD